LSSSCGLGESGFGPNKATAYLVRSIGPSYTNPVS
jgi:hypothetical protein